MKKTKDYAVIVSIFSAAIALACIGIVAFHNFDQSGVVELGTFIGIGVALISTCATLIVGLQILNYIEFKEIKNRIKNIDSIEENIKNAEIKIEKTRRHSAVWMSNTIAMFAVRELDPQSRIDLYITSIAMLTQYIKQEYVTIVINRYNNLIIDINITKRIEQSKLTNWSEFKLLTYSSDNCYDQIRSKHIEVIYKIEQLLNNTTESGIKSNE